MSKIKYLCVKCKSESTKWNIKSRGQRICNDCGTCYTIDDGRKMRAMDEELKDLKSSYKELSNKHDELNRVYTLLNNGKDDIVPPSWLTPKSPKVKKCTASVMLSDTHFDEVVTAREVNYVNAYNREIAKRRLKRFFEKTVMLSRDYVSGVEIEGLVLNLGGDMVSGNIHDELRITNEDGIMATVVYWTEQLAAGIEMLAQYFEKIHIPCVTGNHGRNSIKPVKKGRARDNFDWLIYKWLELHFKDWDQITFQISDDTDCRYSVYNTRYQLTHGDQFRGGSGISGIWTPIKLGDHRKRQREQATGTPYDILLMGHFHQHIDGGSFMVNGSLKGYDEFAASCNFGFEEPTQWWWLTDPIRGKTITAPIHCYKAGEGWEK